MPKLNRDRIRLWLEEHDWSIGTLAEKCDVPEGTMRNAVNGIDPIRMGRIRKISQVTADAGDHVPVGELVATAAFDPAADLGRSA